MSESVVDSDVGSIVFTSGGGGGAPAWFAGLAEKTWTVIAKGTGSDFTSGATLASQNPSSPNQGGTFSVITPWTGAAVATDYKELILPANGGHGDYWGNEVYALKLNQATPAWQRYTDPTPNPASAGDPMDISGSNFPGPAAYRHYYDGRPAAMHTAGTLTYANGKVWVMCQSAFSNIGNSNNSIWSWNRAATSPALPEGYTGGVGRWAYLGDGVLSNPNMGGFNPSAYDPVRGLAWGFIGLANYPKYWWSVNVTTNAITRYSQQPDANGAALYTFEPKSWACCLDDLNVVIIDASYNGSSANDNRVAVLDLNNPTSIIAKATVGYPGGIATTAGGVYHKPSSSILVHESRYQTTGQMYKLKIPRTVGGLIDMAAPWNWTTVNKAGAVNPAYQNVPSPFAGTYSKFNIIPDMGNGQACIVLAIGQNTGGTYVYKLPTTEIF